MNKYRNKKVRIDNILFDSKKEAQYYMELKILDRGGILKILEIHPVFKFPMGFKYIADFKVQYPDGKIEVIDVKGVKTQVYQIKKKCFKYFYPKLAFMEKR